MYRWKSYQLCCWRTFINAPSHTHIRWGRNQPCLYRWTTEARTEGWHKKAAGNVVWWKCQTKTSRLSTVACLIKLQCCLCIRVCVPLCMCGYVRAYTHMFWQVYNSNITVIQRKYCHFLPWWTCAVTGTDLIPFIFIKLILQCPSTPQVNMRKAEQIENWALFEEPTLAHGVCWPTATINWKCLCPADGFLNIPERL